MKAKIYNEVIGKYDVNNKTNKELLYIYYNLVREHSGDRDNIAELRDDELDIIEQEVLFRMNLGWRR